MYQPSQLKAQAQELRAQAKALEAIAATLELWSFDAAFPVASVASHVEDCARRIRQAEQPDTPLMFTKEKSAKKVDTNNEND